MQLKFSLDSPLNSEVINYIQRFGHAKKIPGTVRYNVTATGNTIAHAVKWAVRYYGIQADGSFVKRTFCYSNGNIYLGNDVTGALTSVYSGLKVDCYPEHVIQQVAGNSRMFLFNGYDTPLYYEGDALGTFYQSAITYKFVQGVIKDDRLWGFTRNSSTLYFSRILYPEDFSVTYGGSIIIGNEKDSFIRRIELLGDDLYIFKNDSIWVLRGSTKASYTVDRVISNMGLLAQRALTQVSSALVFVCQQDKEIYEFTETPSPRKLSSNLFDRKIGFKDLLDLTKTDDIVCGWDTVNNLFRVSFNDIAARESYQNSELIFPTDDFNKGGRPKWSQTYGARISCYSLQTRQGDHELLTGRADLGALMYHNRGYDFDNRAIETILRTDDFIPSAGRNTQFDGLYPRGVPSNGTITIRAYLNHRHSGRSSQAMADIGEQDTLGGIVLSTQYRFGNYLPLLTGQNVGESLALEFYDAEHGKNIQLEDVVLDVVKRDKIRSALIPG